MKEILLIIPAYNEEKNIGGVLQELRDSGTLDYMDVLVIDDGSADNTSQVAGQYEEVEVVRQVYNMGYGAALQTGYKYAQQQGYSYLLQMDADGQHDLKNLEVICRRLGCFEQGEPSRRLPDIVIGSRFLDGSDSFAMSKIRLVAIRMFQWVIRMLTGYRLTDPTSGLQGMNRRAFSYYAQYSNFDIKYPDLNMVIQMLLLGYHIEEIPAVMHPRTQGVSMHSGALHAMKYMVVMALSTMVAFIRYRRRWGKRGKKVLQNEKPA